MKGHGPYKDSACYTQRQRHNLLGLSTQCHRLHPVSIGVYLLEGFSVH